jgi:hypothetical protein
VDQFIRHFRDGGWGMFPTLLIGAVMLSVAVKYAVAPSRRLLPLLLSLSVLTVATGALGFVSHLITTCGAVERGHFAGQDARILILDFGESLNDTAFALLFVVLAALCASYGALRQSAQRARPSEAEVHARARAPESGHS